jgi:eukaryotic-like serine/threonine-protein kinase
MQSLLGGGRRHEVYAAFDQDRLAPVVVKIVRPGRVKDASVLKATRMEIDILTRLTHPVVVRILDSMASGPRPFLTQERVSGRTLYKVVKHDGPISADRATELGVALASAVHFIHQRGIVHLDIKPENVILGRPPRLIDFGLATTTVKAAVLPGATGTPRAAAPEQCHPPTTGTPGPASDVWGLAVTLYEAITGTRPFPSNNPDRAAPLEARFPQLAVPPTPLPPSLPAEFSRIVMECLRRDPADRPTAAELFFTLAEQVGTRNPDGAT